MTKRAMVPMEGDHLHVIKSLISRAFFQHRPGRVYQRSSRLPVLRSRRSKNAGPSRPRARPPAAAGSPDSLHGPVRPGAAFRKSGEGWAGCGWARGSSGRFSASLTTFWTVVGETPRARDLELCASQAACRPVDGALSRAYIGAWRAAAPRHPRPAARHGRRSCPRERPDPDDPAELPVLGAVVPCATTQMLYFLFH